MFKLNSQNKKTLLFSYLFFALTACGGSNSSSTNENDSSSSESNSSESNTETNTENEITSGGNFIANNRRISTINVDFDTNEIFEGRQEFFYNDIGQIIRTEYEYIDDGTEDLETQNFGVGDFNQTITYAYDDLNRLVQYTIITDQSTIEIGFTWNDDNLVVETTTMTFNSAGEITLASRSVPTYNETRVISWQIFLNFATDPSIVGNYFYEEEMSSPSRSEVTTFFGNSENVTITDYSYTDFGRFSSVLDPNFLTAENIASGFRYFYNQDNQIIEELSITPGLGFNQQTNVVSTRFTYTNGFLSLQTVNVGDDDRIETTAVIESEEGPCTTAFAWLANSFSNLPVSEPRLYFAGTGYGDFSVCLFN